ncbi:Tc toxin subunit A [Mixta intestinalis]|uniref:Tc toxin subunit A n=1 Tax=Mixta intestinalis TaxID=1615494 RepID=UPI00136DE579
MYAYKSPTVIFRGRISTKLQKAGYRTVFDIVNQSHANFINTVPDMDVSHTQQLYRQAQEHAATQKHLFRSWHLPHRQHRPGSLFSINRRGSQPTHFSYIKFFAGYIHEYSIVS